jgi:hypothetical protein
MSGRAHKGRSKIMQQQAVHANKDAASAAPLSFFANNITGSSNVPVEFDGALSVGSVTQSIADRMALPSDVVWALRDDDSSAYLDDSSSIGSVLKPGSKVTITPKTHLGGTDGMGR